jgi:DnaJ-class molecular chaperone
MKDAARGKHWAELAIHTGEAVCFACAGNGVDDQHQRCWACCGAGKLIEHVVPLRGDHGSATDQTKR